MTSMTQAEKENPSIRDDEPPPLSDPSALARKRRREKLLSQRLDQCKSTTNNALSPTSLPSATSSIPLSSSTALPPKKRNIATPDLTLSSPDNNNDHLSKKQKTQMRYEPSTPMTKEDAAAWRREARRVRNRESAAASRRKTRDRIHQLENDVESWKTKYFAALERLQQYERQTPVVSAPSSPRPQSRSDGCGNAKTLALLNAAAVERSALKTTTSGSSSSNSGGVVVSPCSSPVLSPQASPAGTADMVDDKRL